MISNNIKTSIKISRFLLILLLFIAAYHDIKAQINLTIDQTALNADRVNAAPFPIRCINSPSLRGGKFPVTIFTTPGTPLTDVATGNTFLLSLISHQFVSVKDPTGLNKTIKTTETQFIPGVNQVNTEALGDFGYPDANATIDDPLLYPKLLIPNLKSSAWKKGTYVATFKLEDWRQRDGSIKNGVGGTISPSSFNLTVDIPALLKIIHQNLPEVNLEINDLSHFRNGLPVNNPAEKLEIILQHTVPFSLDVQQGITTYKGRDHKNTPNPFTPFIIVSIENKNGLIVYTGNFQTRDIPVGNKTKLIFSFGMTADYLKKKYAWAGTYENLDGNKIMLYEILPTGSQELRSETSTPIFKVTVSDLREVIVKDNQVNLEFKTATDYINGIKVTMPAHLRTSSTVPFNLTVKSESGTFLLNGAPSELPCSLLQLRSSLGKSDLKYLSVSTSAQSLISDALPAIEQDIDVEYYIPSNPILVPAKKGTYTLNLTYAMEAI